MRGTEAGGEGDDEEQSGGDEAGLREPIAPGGVKAHARIERDGCDEGGVHFSVEASRTVSHGISEGVIVFDVEIAVDEDLGFDDVSIAIDEGRDTHVGGAGQRDAVFDTAEQSGDEVLVMLAAAVEPAVVGEVDEAVDVFAVRRAVDGQFVVREFGRFDDFTNKVRDGVFKTDDR